MLPIYVNGDSFYRTGSEYIRCQGRQRRICFLNSAVLLIAFLVLVFSKSIFAGCSIGAGSIVSGIHNKTPTYTYEVIARYPHDPDVYTQGLVFYQGQLFESTGLEGHSSVRRIDIESGKVLKISHLDNDLFGEGLTVLNQQLVQLTWKSGKAITYMPSSLKQTGYFTYPGEGWGGTVIDAQVVISDGSSWLKFLDVNNYQLVNRVQVTEQGLPVEGLNELETVDNLIYANIYPGDCIAQINPKTGQVLGWIDLRGLMPLSDRPNSSAVANGIAYDKETRAMYVTGKLWPYIFQLRLLTSEVSYEQRFILS